MPPKFFQDQQDTRTWVLENLIRHEGYLDSRMYACADLCINQNLINDLKDVLKTWEDYKIRFPIEKIPNRL
jgi:hypothetical protein